MHTSMALSPDGVPLGIIGNYIWSRGEKKDKSLNYSKPIEEKESFKWVSALEDYSNLIERKLPTITVCDRESGFNRFFQVSEDLNQKFIIRSFRDRNIRTRYHSIKMYDEVKKKIPFDKK